MIISVTKNMNAKRISISEMILLLCSEQEG